MNIQISDSWLREFIETKATPEQIEECLSLCSQSVEKIIDDRGEKVYDIEITTNRPDCLSVYGIARELAAILPRFNIPAKLKDVPSLKIEKPRKSLPLTVKITKADLCPRFTSLIYDNIEIKPSPKFAQKRLNASGIRALNNVIDLSNYLMLELGQPMHTFDYDKILKNKMILREAKEGEEIITLDGQTRKLHEEIIIIEDGKGRIVDLCGIMGAKNSETDENTKRVLLFVQTYNPMKIRRACQVLGFRTEAASRFEKGMDPEGVITTMERATLLFKEWCNGTIGSDLIDIYANPQKEKTVSVSKEKIDSLVGIDIPITESEKILKNLGFETNIEKDTLSCVVPHWRYNDISIQEDLIEEIARIYGYHNLPNVLPPITTLDKPKDTTFDWEYKIKTALKYWGFTETTSYSMVGKNLLDKVGLNPKNHLKISNPLTDDLVYLRTSLIPSLLEIISKNNEQNIRIFEMANLYLPKGNENLPDEAMELTLATTADNYSQLKGILESLLKELGIADFEIKPIDNWEDILRTSMVGIYIQDLHIGITGKIKKEFLDNFSIKGEVLVLDLEVRRLLKFATNAKKYIPSSKYPSIIEDLSFVIPEHTFIGQVIDEIKFVSELVKNVNLIDSFQNTRTFRVEYQSEMQNLSDNEIKPIREKIIKVVEKKFQARLKD